MSLTPKQAHWQSVIDEWRHSGLTQKSFCQQRDINLHAFGYWIKKFRVASHEAASSDHSSAAFMCLTPGQTVLNSFTPIIEIQLASLTLKTPVASLADVLTHLKSGGWL